MKTSLRAFGIGIFLAGAIFAGYDYFFPKNKASDIKELEKQLVLYEQQIEKLTSQLEQKSAALDKADSKQPAVDSSENKAVDKKAETSESAASDVVKATIYIYEDVSIYTIGQQAEDLGIVKNGRELELHLAKPEYARSIQKGAFDLSSDMTIEEIAKTLTGKKLD